MCNRKLRWFRYESEKTLKKLNLFCFHHAGGSARLYKEWQKYVGEEINVYPIQLPMRENRHKEALGSSIEENIREFLREHQDMFEHPYALFGHSLGSVYAMELAYELEERKKFCQGLFVSATSFPKGKMKREVFSQEEIFEKLDVLEGVNEDLLKSEIFMQYFMPIITKDLELYCFYEWKHGNQRLSCPLYIFGGKQDPSISIREMLTWRECSDSYLGAHFFEGGHFYLNRYIEQVLEIIKKYTINKC